MKTKTQFIVYILSLPWNLTVAWPTVLFVWLFWGKNLRLETPPLPNPGGPVLACEMKAGSWPARTWYVQRRDENGKPHTWGATTLGHAIFYGVDIVKVGEWSHVQEHEHVHVEQFGASMVGALVASLWVGITVAALGHWMAALVIGGLIWWSGFLQMCVGGWVVAALRGENAYRGSAHEESAYSQGDAYRDREGR